MNTQQPAPPPARSVAKPARDGDVTGPDGGHPIRVAALARATAAQAAANSRAAAQRSKAAVHDLRDRQRRLRSTAQRLAAAQAGLAATTKRYRSAGR
jgi:hypothetical protein